MTADPQLKRQEGLAAITVAAEVLPKLRLGQIISAAFEAFPDLYYVTDEEFAKGLWDFVNEYRTP